MLSQVALITGGSSGIGAACVSAFRAAGWRVSAAALSGPELDALAAQGVVITPGDLSTESARDAAVEKTLAAYGRIDALINNAGVGLYGLPTDVSIESFGRILDVNVVAPLALAQRVIPVMCKQGSGVVVNVGSVAGDVSLPWAAAYCASKSALHAIHDALRRQLRGAPIHFIKVCPGIVGTKFRDNVLHGEAPDAVRRIRYVVPAEAVAAGILRAIKRRSGTVYIPRIGALFAVAGTLAPALMDAYLARFLDRTGSLPPSLKTDFGSERIS